MTEPPFVKATVVRAQSPTSVRAGDSATVRADGTIEGFVGGACADESVRLNALRALETGEPLLLRILPAGADGEGAEGEGTVTVKNPCLSGGALEIFLEPQLPAPVVRIWGETPIAHALVDLAGRLGYAAERGGEPGADDAAVIVASHGRDEEHVLTAALSEGVAYVGLVASRSRGAAVVESLDLPEALRGRLHTPAGLEIGARTPEEIALSILAEIVALRRSGEPRGGARRVVLDPVCGMEVAVCEASVQLERGGERHYFCSEGCRERFAAGVH